MKKNLFVFACLVLAFLVIGVLAEQIGLPNPNSTTAFTITGTNIEVIGGISKIKGVATVWPSSQGGAGTQLQNDGSGNLSWTAPGTSGTVINSGASTTVKIPQYSDTTGTNVAPVAISGDATLAAGGALSLKATGTAGAYTKPTFDAQGRETSGTSATLASADYANQGTATTILHGNASGNPSWAAVDLSSAEATGTMAAARFPALTGDVTTSAGSLATTIAAGAVTLADHASMATASVVGRNTAGTGAPEILTTLPSGVQANITQLGIVTAAGTLTISSGSKLVVSANVNQINNAVIGSFFTDTATSGSEAEISGEIYANPASASSAIYSGLFGGGYRSTANAQNLTAAVGVAGVTAYPYVRGTGAGTVTGSASFLAYTVATNAGIAVTKSFGLYLNPNNSGNTVYGVYGTTPSATINNWYATRFDNISTAPSSISYGAYYGTGMSNYFGGNVQIDGTTSHTGDIVKINNVTTTFPSSQGAANTVLMNNGSGTLTWRSPADADAFVITADGTVANTSSATTMLGTVVGTKTLPANFFTAGSATHGIFRGRYSTKTVSPGTITIDVKLGSTTIATTGAQSVPAASATKMFDIDVDINCRTASATGTVFAQGKVLIGDTTGLIPQVFPMVNTTTSTVDTTGTLVFDVQATWSVADTGNTVTISVGSLQ